MRLKNDQGGTVENSIGKNQEKNYELATGEKNLISTSREKFKKEADAKFGRSLS